MNMIRKLKIAALYGAPLSPLSRYARAAAIRLGVAAAIVSLASACSPGPMPISQSLRDASNPAAPEGVSPLSSGSAAPVLAAAKDSEHEHHRHDSEDAASRAKAVHEGHGAVPASDAGAQEAVYVCPMHSEVTSSAAGICPKCNMKLVLKK